MTPVITTVAITVLSILTGLGTTETATDNERRSFICRPLHQARRDGNHTCFERHSFCWLVEHNFFCLRRSCAAYIKKVKYSMTLAVTAVTVLTTVVVNEPIEYGCS